MSEWKEILVPALILVLVVVYAFMASRPDR